MATRIQCTKCGEAFDLLGEVAGRCFTCKVCGASSDIPGRIDVSRESRGLEARPSISKRISSRTFWPAVCLYFISALSVVHHTATMVMAVTGASVERVIQPEAREKMTPEDLRTSQRLFLVGGLSIGGFGLTVDLLTIVGAYSLQRLRNYPLAIVGSAVAAIPCLSPCVVLGIPFGIWALLLLFSRQVRDVFQ